MWLRHCWKAWFGVQLNAKIMKKIFETKNIFFLISGCRCCSPGSRASGTRGRCCRPRSRRSTLLMTVRHHLIYWRFYKSEKTNDLLEMILNSRNPKTSKGEPVSYRHKSLSTREEFELFETHDFHFLLFCFATVSLSIFPSLQLVEKNFLFIART